MSERDDTIETIAEVFTGPLVVHHSILLQLGHMHRTMAERYFDARDRLGIHGYMPKAEAVRVLRERLA